MKRRRGVSGRISTRCLAGKADRDDGTSGMARFMAREGVIRDEPGTHRRCPGVERPLDGLGWGHIMESSGASPQAVRRHKRCVATSGASPQAVRRHKRCVATSGASPQAVRRHKRCVATSGASPQAVRRHKRCVATSGASPQAVRRHKRCVATSGASPQAVRRQ